MSYKFSTRSLAKLNNPKVHPKIKQLMLEAIKTSPIDFTIIETVRTLETQKEYLKKGTTKTLKSRHIPSTNQSGYCEAIDIVPYPIDWDDIPKFKRLAEHIKKTAKMLNIDISHGGDWKSFKDYPHWELQTKK